MSQVLYLTIISLILEFTRYLLLEPVDNDTGKLAVPEFSVEGSAHNGFTEALPSCAPNV